MVKETDLKLAGGRTLHCHDAELWLRPDEGHVSVLGSCALAVLDWLVAHA